MSKKGASQWISLSDMMTGLMLVFLLLSVLAISEIQKKEKNKNKVLVEYNNVKADIHKDLKKAFEEKEKEWEMTIDDDLTIKFNNPDVLFRPDNTSINEGFSKILDDFIPKYLAIINNKKYGNQIKEVRIEGHAGKCLEFEYMYCLTLSQGRANSVLEYLFNSESYKILSVDDKSKLKFLFTSNGMSDGKNLDSNGDYIYYSKKLLDSKVSRRVEFRIVTNTENIVEDLLKKFVN